MERIFWEAVEENPIIAAVKNMEDLEKCCSLSDIHVVFILFGDICSIADIVQKVKEAGKIAMIHVDLIGGLSTREIAVEFLKNNSSLSSDKSYILLFIILSLRGLNTLSITLNENPVIKVVTKAIITIITNISAFKTPKS